MKEIDKTVISLQLKKKLEKKIIKIKVFNHTKGSVIGKGFFCKLSHPKLSNLFIITSNRTLNNDNMKNDIEITTLDNNKSYIIKKDDSRKTFTNPLWNVTLIEILKKDKININSYFEIDDKLYGDISNQYSYINNLICLFQYPYEDNKLDLYKGIINTINENNFVYSLNGVPLSGSPIIHLSNKKILGIHKSNAGKGCGIFFNEIIEKFLKKDFNNNKTKKKSKDKNKIIKSLKTNKKKSQLLNSKEDIDINETYFICQKCKLVPFFILKNKLYIKCNCEEVKKDLNYLCDKYIIEKNEENELNISKECLKCLKHKKKYKYYCQKCEEDLCNKCLLENDHHEHKIIIFDSLILNTNIKIEKIQDILKENFENNKKDNLLIKNLAKIIINQYKEYTCYNIFKNIDNIYQKLLSKINKNNANNNIIRKSKRFIDNNYNAESNEINCVIKENILDASFLIEKNPEKLEILELQETNISELSILENVNFVNLRHFNLSKNRIDNKNIAYLQGCNFKKLIYFDVSSNRLNDFSFFERVNNFPKLRKLYISSNKFNDDIENLKNNIYNLSHIEEIGLSDGVFSDKSIELLKNFKFDNLKGLFLSYNQLSSLSFIKDLDCPILEEIYLDNNNLCEFEPLIKFTNIKIIQINNNEIKDINNLKNFVNELKQLKKLSIKGNKLEKKNDNILREIKKEGKIKIFYKATDA